MDMLYLGWMLRVRLPLAQGGYGTTNASGTVIFNFPITYSSFVVPIGIVDGYHTPGFTFYYNNTSATIILTHANFVARTTGGGYVVNSNLFVLAVGK